MPTHYDDKYFEWQRSMGVFTAKIDGFKFAPFVRADDTVVEFGCGGGYLLATLHCKEKVGIEINPAAREETRRQGLTVYETPEDLPDAYASLVISHHALEHVEDPLGILRSLRRKMRTGGRIVFVVPHEGPKGAFREDDISQHLYTWNPLTLGNLFKAAGFTVVQSENIRHQWPIFYMQCYRCCGQGVFHQICKVIARLRGNYQVRVVAEKQ